MATAEPTAGLDEALAHATRLLETQPALAGDCGESQEADPGQDEAGEQGQEDCTKTSHLLTSYQILMQNGPARFEGGEGMRAGPMLLSSAAGGR